MNIERNTLYDKIKQRALQKEREQLSSNIPGKTCKVLIGKVASETIITPSFSSTSSIDFSVNELLQYLTIFQNDNEMVYQIIYYLTLLIVEPFHRIALRDCNGIKQIITILKQYQNDLFLVKCCCSCLNNAGSTLISKEIVDEIEYIQQLYPYDSFLKTVLAACYANYARFHSESMFYNGSIKKLSNYFKENDIPTDLELALLAAFSNIARNSRFGQIQCVSFKLHEIIIDKLMTKNVCEDYWTVACNTLGCFAVNANGNECKEVVEYAFRKRFIYKLLSLIHLVVIDNENSNERLLSCLAKFCLIVPLYHIPQLHWLCYQSMRKEEIYDEEYSHLPITVKQEFQKKLFTCHVCKMTCDPYVFRSLRFNDSIILMSYCSIHCWLRRHEMR